MDNKKEEILLIILVIILNENGLNLLIGIIGLKNKR